MFSKNKTRLALFLFLALMAGFLFFFQPVLADDFGAGAAKGNLPGTGGGDIALYLGNVAGAVIILSGSIFLFLMVYGGIMIMTSSGNQEKIGKGKNIIIWAIVGALILGSAFAITQLVFTAIGGGGGGTGQGAPPTATGTKCPNQGDICTTSTTLDDCLAHLPIACKQICNLPSSTGTGPACTNVCCVPAPPP